MDLAKVVAVDKRRKKVRVGRGSGSGLGKTSGRGSKGASSRTGFGGLLHREGGQMPLIRRIPEHTGALFYLGVTLAKLQRYSEAVAAWDRVTRIDPGGPFAQRAKMHARTAVDLQHIFSTSDAA